MKGAAEGIFFAGGPLGDQTPRKRCPSRARPERLLTVRRCTFVSKRQVCYIPLGQATKGRDGPMPLVTVQVHEGQLDAQQKARMIALVSEAAIEGEGLGDAGRASTWVQIQEIPAGAFGVGGQVVTWEHLRARIAAAGGA
jgi:4-oxalocrotonate tautomerase